MLAFVLSVTSWAKTAAVALAIIDIADQKGGRKRALPH
jgi:hypothetical protein